MFSKVNCTVFSKFASTATTYIVSLSNKKFKNPFPIFKTLGCITIALEPIESSMLLEPFWRISLYVTDDAIAKVWET